MSVQPLVGADPLRRAVGHLSRSPVVAGALGGPGRVGGTNAPPYPRLLVTDPPGGDLRSGRWLTATSVQLELYGDPDATQTRDQLRRAMLTVLAELVRLPEAPPGPGEPVITAVTLDGGVGFSATATRQKRYLAGATIWAHPSP